MSLVTKVNIEEDLAIVQPTVSLWGGDRLPRKDLADLVAGVPLPTEGWTDIRLASSQDLAWGNRLKARMHRTCRKYGVRLLGGYAVPKADLPKLVEELDPIIDEAEKAQAAFVTEYHNQVEAFIKANPEWETAIRGVLTSKEEITRRYRFSYTVFTFGSAPKADETAGAAEQ